MHSYKPWGSGWRVGLADLGIAGLVLRECPVFRQGRKTWVGLPAKPQIDSEGRHRVDPATGKKLYTPVVTIPDPEIRSRFSAAALAALRAAGINIDDDGGEP